MQCSTPKNYAHVFLLCCFTVLFGRCHFPHLSLLAHCPKDNYVIISKASLATIGKYIPSIYHGLTIQPQKIQDRVQYLIDMPYAYTTNATLSLRSIRLINKSQIACINRELPPEPREHKPQTVIVISCMGYTVFGWSEEASDVQTGLCIWQRDLEIGHHFNIMECAI